MTKKTILMVPVALLAVTVAAFAGTIQLREVGTNPQTVVNVTIPAAGGGIFYSGGVYAGFYVLEIQGQGLVSGFCVDPSFSNSSFSTYNLLTIPEGSNYERAAWLLNQFKGQTSVATNVQLAVWSIIFPSGFTVNSSGFDYQPYVTLANSANLAAFDQSGYRLAVSPPEGKYFGVNYQDYVIPVPEPGMPILLGIALALMAAFWKRMT